MLQAGSLFGQTSAQLDSIVKVNSTMIYDQPLQVIERTQQVINHKTATDRTRINAYVLLSDAYSSLREYQKALLALNEAEKLLVKTKHSKQHVIVLVKTAIQYQQLKIFDKTIEYLNLAEKQIDHYPYPDSVASYLGSSNVVRGLIYKDKLNCDIAIAYLKKGISIYDQYPAANLRGNSSIAHYNIGNCYSELEDYPQAIAHFQDAVDIAKSIQAKSLIAFAQKGLANVYTLQGKYHQAIEELNKAATNAKDVGDKILNMTIERSLSENHLALNNWTDYLQYNNAYIKSNMEVKKAERFSISNRISVVEEEQVERVNELEAYYRYTQIGRAHV